MKKMVVSRTSSELVDLTTEEQREIEERNALVPSLEVHQAKKLLHRTDKEMENIAEEAIEIFDGLIKEIDPNKDVKSRFSQKTKDLLKKRADARARL